MMKRHNYSFVVDLDNPLSFLWFFAGAAITGELSASAHGKEHTDCLSVPNQQHQGHRGNHSSKGRRHTRRSRIGNTLSSGLQGNRATGRPRE